MVMKMRFDESKISPVQNSSFATDFALPVFEEPQVELWPSRMSWAEAMRHFAPTREHYMRYFDSPERRLRDKNPKPFRVP